LASSTRHIYKNHSSRSEESQQQSQERLNSSNIKNGHYVPYTSRRTASSILGVIWSVTIKGVGLPVTAQESDDELRTLLVSTTALQLERILILGTSVELYCDTSSGKPRPYVPFPLHRQIFDYLHSLSHPGIKATVKLVSQRFVWPAIRRTATLGPELANPASAPNFPATPLLQSATSPSLLPAFYTSTLT